MKSEPIAILELVRLLAYAAGLLGFVVTVEDQAVIAAGIAGAVAAVSVIIAIIQRLSVFSPKTTEKLVQQAAVTGIPYVGDPPAGDLPAAQG